MQALVCASQCGRLAYPSFSSHVGCCNPALASPLPVPALILPSGSRGPTGDSPKISYQSLPKRCVFMVTAAQTSMTQFVIAFTGRCYSLALPNLQPSLAWPANPHIS